MSSAIVCARHCRRCRFQPGPSGSIRTFNASADPAKSGDQALIGVLSRITNRRGEPPADDHRPRLGRRTRDRLGVGGEAVRIDTSPLPGRWVGLLGAWTPACRVYATQRPYPSRARHHAAPTELSPAHRLLPAQHPTSRILAGWIRPTRQRVGHRDQRGSHANLAAHLASHRSSRVTHHSDRLERQQRPCGPGDTTSAGSATYSRCRRPCHLRPRSRSATS